MNERLSGWRACGDHLTVDLPGARTLFTSRQGGVSSGPYASLNLGARVGDDHAAVRENRARVAQVAGAELALARQVHGTRVAFAPAASEVDGIATDRPGVAPAVLVADCVPIALAAAGGVAMLHGGWRGLAGGIVDAGLHALGEVPSAAAIGPCARPCCYEVGEEVAAQFEPEARRGRNLDLPGVAARRLAAAGVEHVEDCGICTICGDPRRWFSFRREGAATGRQAGVVWRA